VWMGGERERSLFERGEIETEEKRGKTEERKGGTRSEEKTIMRGA
jgi:hypothetical protein